MVEVKDLTQITIKDLWREVKNEEDFWGDLSEIVLRGLKVIAETVMESELLEQLQATRYQRVDSRKGFRNGYRPRSLITQYGWLEIKIPRDRDGKYQPEFFRQYQQRTAEVDKLIREVFLSGVSTRQVGKVLSPLLGKEVSPQTVSRVVSSLDSEVKLFHSRLITDNYEYLFLDGITLRVKGVSGVKKRLMLCAYGITSQGKRELVSFRQASSESEASWEMFLRDLYERGLKGKEVKLAVTDGCAGLHRALDTVYPYTPRQRCWAHKLRNVADRLPRKCQKECLKEAKRIYLAENKREAGKLFRKWSDHWKEIVPRAVECIEVDLDELFNFMDCPEDHRKKIRTTNVIERAFREVRRRTRPMSCFQNSASVERIIYGVVSKLNKNWKEKPLLEFTHNS
jgi:transposase-like protein